MKSATGLRDAVVSTDRSGVKRVGGTRVTLDSVVAGFTEGATPEEIQMRYPALRLSDTYAAIAWYLTHRKSADKYLTERSKLAIEARRECLSHHAQAGLRARLVARTSSRRKAQVPA